MRGTAKANAMRSAVVVLGALSFGYLTLRLGFKPYLEKAELEQQRREAQSAAAAAAAAASHSRDSFDDGFPTDGDNLSSGLLESDHNKEILKTDGGIYRLDHEIAEKPRGNLQKSVQTRECPIITWKESTVKASWTEPPIGKT